MCEIITMISVDFETQNDGDFDSSNPILLLPSRELEEAGEISDVSDMTYSTNLTMFYIGLILNSLTLLGCLLSIVFIIVYRKHRILTMAQPFFLCIVCFGTADIAASGMNLEITGIVLYKDTTSQETLDHLCANFAKLFLSGNILVYMALFAKTWRLQKVTQFRRNQTVRVQHVLWPMILMELTVIGVIIAWFLVDHPEWKTIDDYAVTPSKGYCDYAGDQPVFVCIMVTLMVLSAVLGYWMSRKIPDSLPDELNDGKQIRLVYLIHLVIIACCSLVYFLGRYFKFSYLMGLLNLFLVVPFAITNIGLLFAPKVYSVWYEKTHCGNLPGFGTGAVVVSGINTTTATTTNFTNEESRTQP